MDVEAFINKRWLFLCYSATTYGQCQHFKVARNDNIRFLEQVFVVV